jgi:adenylate kinase
VGISDHFGIAHISSGELLRKHVKDGTSIGRTVEGCLARGDLVSDGIVMDVLRKPVQAASRNGGYVLDGFPRTVPQAEAAYLVAKELGAWVQVALYLDVPRDELIRRLLRRGQQEGRSDDREDVMHHRLRVFDEVSRPMLDYYSKRETLVTIDGDRPVAEVTRSTIAELEQVRARIS